MKSTFHKYRVPLASSSIILSFAAVLSPSVSKGTNNVVVENERDHNLTQRRSPNDSIPLSTSSVYNNSNKFHIGERKYLIDNSPSFWNSSSPFLSFSSRENNRANFKFENKYFERIISLSCNFFSSKFSTCESETTSSTTEKKIQDVEEMVLKRHQTKVYVPNAYEIPIRGKNYPKEVPVFIEVKKGSRMKYEWDKDVGMLRLDRVLHSAVFYPHDYGFIPQTLCDDGDPLDVLVMGDTALEPGSIVDVRIIAYMVMEDEKGVDEKVLAVPANDPRYREVLTLRDIPEHFLREISVFFESYKKLEREKWAKVGGWKGTEDTQELLEETHKRWIEMKAKSL